MSFIDNHDGKTVTIINGSYKITVPSMGFVNNEYRDVSNDSFNSAFKEEAEIEKGV